MPDNAVFVLALLLTAAAADQNLAVAADPETPPRLVASPEPDWPQWRGPRRDGHCDETGLLPRWPESGPRKLWQTGELGRGYSSPVIVGDRLYLTGDVGEELHLFALDLSGRLVWRAANGRAWRTPYPGARASVTWTAGRLYHLNAHGRVACFEAATGRELWAVELFERFGGKNITWALSENLLVDRGRVFVTAGGSRALVAALDARTGETLWQSEPLRLGPGEPPYQVRVAEPLGKTDPASYASPILLEWAGRRVLAGCSLRHFYGVDAETGALLWTRPLLTRYAVIAMTPVLVGDGLFVTAPDTDDGGLFRLRRAGERIYVERAWTTRADTCHGGAVLVGDTLYGSWYRRDKGWYALDTRTGEVRHHLPDLAMGSVLYAEGRLYCLSQEGEMALLEPTPGGLEYRGRFRLVPGRVSDAWAHPVIHRQRLYLRYHETLYCFDIRAATETARP
jgi:outer membrane protein assembly factor BamB